MKKPKIYKNIIKKGLCSGCGTCAGVCPTGALSFKYNFQKNEFDLVFNEKKCLNCGLCYKVCPGKGYNLRKIVKNKKNRGSNFNNFHGYYEFFAQGYSKNKKTRKKGASGGIATELLKFLIKEKKVDRVIIVQLKNNKPIIKITNKIEEIEKAQQSKYVPIPLNKHLKKIAKSNFSYAIVGTPCQIAGQYLAEEKIQNLKNKIKYRIGLLCGYIQTYDCINQVKKGLGIKKEDYKKWELIGWREGKYPGFLTFKNKKTGQIKKKGLYEWLSFCVPFYSLKRCFLCPDGNNELADLVLGDVHSVADDENVIIARTKKGSKLLRKAKEKGYIEFSKLKKKKAEQGVIGSIVRSKKENSCLRIKSLKEKKKPVPDFDFSLKEKRLKSFLINLQSNLIFLFRKKNIKERLAFSPILMESVGKFLYRFPNSVPGYNFILFIYKKIFNESKKNKKKNN